MNIKYLKLILFSLLYLIILSGLRGQSAKEEFDNFKENQSSEFDLHLEKVDKEFVNFLKKNWQKFQIHSGIQMDAKPKPNEFPNANVEQSRSIDLSPDSLSKDALQFTEGLTLPVNYKSITYAGIPRSTVFPFYGGDISIRYDSSFTFGASHLVSPEMVADFWESVSKSDYRLMLEDLLFYKNKYQLNDFGYYLLISDFVQSFLDDKNSRVLLTWYILSKSKYKVKIGYNTNNLFLLLSSDRIIYNQNYLTEHQITYYLMNGDGERLFAYPDHYPGAYKVMSFSLQQPLQLEKKILSREVKMNYQGKAYSFNIKYNKNAIDFYKSFPAMALESYFNSEMTSVAQKSLIDLLLPIVQDMNEYDAVGFLLAFVQDGFDYKVDQEQFGFEKVFFPEEILHFPFSDCEDRSIFFSYLVNTILGKKVIGLDFPFHVATAVNFNTPVAGDYLMVDELKYTVCDPTYMHAPIGMSMRKLNNDRPKIVFVDSKSESMPAMSFILKSLGISGSVESPNIMETKQGTILAGKNTQDFYIQGEKKSEESSYFLASFNLNNQLGWFESFPLGKSIVLLSIVADSSQNIYTLFKDNHNEKFILNKVDAMGEESWSTELKKFPDDRKNTNKRVFLYNTDGGILANKSYSDIQFFEENALKIWDDKLVVILPVD